MVLAKYIAAPVKTKRNHIYEWYQLLEIIAKYGPGIIVRPGHALARLFLHKAMKQVYPYIIDVLL